MVGGSRTTRRRYTSVLAGRSVLLRVCRARVGCQCRSQACLAQGVDGVPDSGLLAHLLLLHHLLLLLFATTGLAMSVCHVGLEVPVREVGPTTPTVPVSGATLRAEKDGSESCLLHPAYFVLAAGTHLVLLLSAA